MWEDFYVDTKRFTKPIKQFSLAIWWITTLSQWNQFYWFCTSRLEIVNMTSYFIVIQKLIWINKYKHGLYQLSLKLSFLKKELVCLVVMNCRRRSEKATGTELFSSLIGWNWDNFLGSASRLVLVVGVALIHYPRARLHQWFLNRCAISARLLQIVENLRVQTCQ